MIGWIDHLGRWLVDGNDGDALPVGAAVVAVIDQLGTCIDDPLGSQARTELGWAGPPELGDRLTPGVTYWVRWPLNAQGLDDRPRTPVVEFERGLAATRVGFGDTGTASCECPTTGPIQVQRFGNLASAG